ncbi:hypothetical protein AURDEDRAFT_159575 [Auricularia subglabra TFB-10046 SS5]|nr:hypothetical protein AURDEDRAFT_159575 [Auricularia subglabra TFB-10046 SS5]
MSLSVPIRIQDEECQTALQALLTRVSLRSVSFGYSLTPEQWGALAASSGATLHTLAIDPSIHDRIEDAPSPITLPASVFLPFVRLTSLQWNCSIPIVFEADTADFTSALPCLSVLNIDDHEKRADLLLSLLAQMRCVDEAKTWLKGAHDKLEVIEFDHAGRSTDRFEGPDCPWQALFDNFDVGRYPALREFRIAMDHLKWPTEQRAVAKSPWTAWGDKLMKHNVKLIDRKAGEWRPRLQTVTRGKRSKITR